MSRQYFDGIWNGRLKENQTGDYVPGENLRVDKALTLAGSGKRILDVGCGFGILLVELKDRFQEVYGIDVSENAVSVALQREIRATTLDFNVSPLPYPDAHFDVITILSTLQYFVDLDRVLTECYRTLIARGHILLSVPNMRAFWRVGRLLFLGRFPKATLNVRGYDGVSLHSFTFMDLAQLLQNKGFRVEYSAGIFCLPRFVEHAGDSGLLGLVKREFFSAEIFIKAKRD